MQADHGASNEPSPFVHIELAKADDRRVDT